MNAPWKGHSALPSPSSASSADWPCFPGRLPHHPPFPAHSFPMLHPYLNPPFSCLLLEAFPAWHQQSSTLACHKYIYDQAWYAKYFNINTSQDSDQSECPRAGPGRPPPCCVTLLCDPAVSYLTLWFLRFRRGAGRIYRKGLEWPEKWGKHLTLNRLGTVALFAERQKCIHQMPAFKTDCLPVSKFQEIPHRVFSQTERICSNRRGIMKFASLARFHLFGKWPVSDHTFQLTIIKIVACVS